MRLDNFWCLSGSVGEIECHGYLGHWDDAFIEVPIGGAGDVAIADHSPCIASGDRGTRPHDIVT